jgi:hypothetical protein
MFIPFSANVIAIASPMPMEAPVYDVVSRISMQPEIHLLTIRAVFPFSESMMKLNDKTSRFTK